MDRAVKRLLEDEYGYDFSSDFFYDEIIVLVNEVIEATKRTYLEMPD